MEAPTTTAPVTAVASPRLARGLPRLGALGIMLELCDEMLPSITERRGAHPHYGRRLLEWGLFCEATGIDPIAI
jgi:hypothetical protein